ncbi:hypothetical protein AB0L25_14940 [Spirillospora sp. NPDC052242]
MMDTGGESRSCPAWCVGEQRLPYSGLDLHSFHHQSRPLHAENAEVSYSCAGPEPARVTVVLRASATGRGSTHIAVIKPDHNGLVLEFSAHGARRMGECLRDLPDSLSANNMPEWQRARGRRRANSVITGDGRRVHAHPCPEWCHGDHFAPGSNIDSSSAFRHVSPLFQPVPATTFPSAGGPVAPAPDRAGVLLTSQVPHLSSEPGLTRVQLSDFARQHPVEMTFSLDAARRLGDVLCDLSETVADAGP